VRLRSALLARRASDEISWGHDVFFHSVPAAHTLVRGVNGIRLRRHSADSTLPPLWPTGSSSGWLPSIPARSFSAGPSDSTSRWTPCPPRFPSRPARHYPRLWIWCSPSEHQWDFNPPEHVAAQRTLWAGPTPGRGRRAVMDSHTPLRDAAAHHAGSPGILTPSVDARPPQSPRTARCVRLLVTSAPVAGFSTFGSLAAAIGFTRPNRVRLRWARAFALVACEQLARPPSPTGPTRFARSVALPRRTGATW